jgi:hypothetical protein
VHHFLNEEKFYHIDPAYTTAEDVFVRSILIENMDDESDTHHSATIGRTTGAFVPFVAGQSLIDITLRLENRQNYTVITRAGWYDAIGNIGGMQGFIIMIVGIVLGNVTEVDFVCDMVKGLYL